MKYKIRIFEGKEFVCHEFNTLKELESWVNDMAEEYKELYRVTEDDEGFKHYKNSFMKKNVMGNFCHIIIEDKKEKS